MCDVSFAAQRTNDLKVDTAFQLRTAQRTAAKHEFYFGSLPITGVSKSAVLGSYSNCLR